MRAAGWIELSRLNHEGGGVDAELKLKQKGMCVCSHLLQMHRMDVFVCVCVVKFRELDM